MSIRAAFSASALVFATSVISAQDSGTGCHGAYAGWVPEENRAAELWQGADPDVAERREAVARLSRTPSERGAKRRVLGENRRQ